MTHHAHEYGGFERQVPLAALDGTTLSATLYEPRGIARANLVILGALAVPARFYTRFARAMAERGLRVLTFDYRGVSASRSRPLRGYRASVTDWAELDAPAAVRFLADHHGAVPTLALGHSLGGQIFALDERSRRILEGAFVVASQSGFYGTFEGRSRLMAQLFWFGILPTATGAFGYLPGWAGLGEDIPRGAAEQWCAWCKSEDYFLSTHPHYRDALAAFTGPLHAVSFSDDWYAPRANVDWLLARYRGATVHHEHLRPADVGVPSVGHFGFFSPRHRDTLWPRVARFVADVVGLTSSAA